jgi:DNA-directed RNA polymerase subunit RPC12/RpoP
MANDRCQNCGAEVPRETGQHALTPSAGVVRCPSCGAHAPGDQIEGLVGALEELFGAISPLRRKFTLAFDVNSEEMPPPYDEAPTVARKEALLDEEESEDEEDVDEDEEEARDLDF